MRGRHASCSRSLGLINLPGVGVGGRASGGDLTPATARPTDEVGPLIGTLRSAGYGEAAERARALYGQPNWTTSDMDLAQRAGAYFDAAVVTNAPWRVLDLIDSGLPPESRPSTRGLIPHPVLDRQAGRTSGWNRRRFNRTVALLLRAPGNPDRPEATKADRAVYLTLAGQQTNPTDHREPLDVIVQHARQVANDLDARGLTWTSGMIHHAMRVATSDPSRALTPGNVVYQSATALESGFSRAGSAVTDGLRTGLAWRIPLVLAAGLGYVVVRRLR